MAVFNDGCGSLPINCAFGCILFHDWLHVSQLCLYGIFQLLNPPILQRCRLFLCYFYMVRLSNGELRPSEYLVSNPIISAYSCIDKLALALARLFEGPESRRDQTFHKADQQALCSLLSFMAGNCLGRIGHKVGAQRRIWLISDSLISTLFTMAAAIAFWKSGQPSLASERAEPAWTNTATFFGIAFMSASLGIQGILGKRLNTQFGTTSASLIDFFCLSMINFFLKKSY